ncbi:MAG: DEAD/DEAH box helicase [Kiritimatiellae bacterium]|nr:DEAD/DEAH box helicase [Kiritimatiellia bacterium]
MKKSIATNTDRFPDTTRAVGFLEVLGKYRADSLSEAEKGTKFEELMRTYLLNLPKYKGMFDKVWLWHDFPFRKDFGSGHDLGIDLVALTVSGEYWAVQCKCYQDDAYITKEAVDTFLSTSGKRFGDGSLEPKRFSRRLWIATTDKWSDNAETSLLNQVPTVMKIGLGDLVSSPVDWADLEFKAHGGRAVTPVGPRSPYEHQLEAVAAARAHFAAHDRGKLIMACGTGKTYTSLKIAEDEVKSTGLVLFLVPSIALLGQTLNEWTANAASPIRPMCVCSDAEVSKKQKSTDDGGFTVEELAFPASTNVDAIVSQFKQLNLLAKTNGGFRVVFSTYQSLPQVIKAQKALNAESPHQADFDLVICDEAHRTTGAAAKESRESAFILVHENSNLVAQKRLYMTATPRIYSDKAKEDAKREDAYFCSMDDESIYGEEFYRIGFGKAVEKGLLSDYKVLVLAVPEIPQELKAAVTASSGEIKMDDAAKLVGCVNALSKQLVKDSEAVRREDPSLMHKAVAFCANINASRHIVSSFNALRDKYYESLSPEERSKLVAIEADHVDGTMGAAKRQQKLAWLDGVGGDTNTCHVLSNVRCLSEGVDVPSLDAVLFLSARNSQVDVVQSVGRVMRRAPGKKYGYVIIPVVIPPEMSPEEALDNSDVYNVVWTVLNALRAHDDHFDAEINKIELNKGRSDKILVGIAETGGPRSVAASATATQDEFDFKAKIYAKMVKKVGTRRYWSLWAEEVAKIAARHSERLRTVISTPGAKRDEFVKFLTALRENLNPAVTEDEAADMLVQHALTKPVFDAVFDGYDFAASNVVSKAMQNMVDLLHEEVPQEEMKAMEDFYKSVAERAEGIDNAEGKQRVIYELYDKFFRTAFPKMSEQLGIVYTPVECVDFIINSVEDVLNKEFGQSLSDKDVHVIDPFTGTGTFMTRLLQSGHIKPKDLKRKYTQELHANEIVLLAYYIASVNIESVYHDLMNVANVKMLPIANANTHCKLETGTGNTGNIGNIYQPFEGICLTDTFELYEKDGVFETQDFQQNSARVKRQRKSPIRIVIGNPPYNVESGGQSYPKLEAAIARTYAAKSTATLQMQLYDSYIKAFRWATDRLEGGKGIVAFISNAGWLDASAMDGFRETLQEEFDSIYVFNLRGNQRTSGELSRKEGGKIFGSGSRTPIAITLLVRGGNSRVERVEHVENESAKSTRSTCSTRLEKKARIYYRDIGDYLSREKKLEIVKDMRSMLDPKMDLVEIHPNAKNDWINQRDGVFDSLIPIGDKKDKTEHTVFAPNYSGGAKTSRDTWLYNFSRPLLSKNMQSTIDVYNENEGKEPIVDETKIKWTRGLLQNLGRGRKSNFDETLIVHALYRPFCKQQFYYDPMWIEMPLQIPRLFPTATHKNRLICISGEGVTKPFSCIMTDIIPDYELIGKSQCFPLYVYTKEERGEQMSLFDKGDDEYRCTSGITDFMLERCRAEFGEKVTKEDIFYFIYGVLHSPDYRKRFEADLKKSLARIPLPKTGADFAAFVKAGRKLGDLHCGYETVKPWEGCVVDVVPGYDSPYHVTKMKFAKKDNPTDENKNGKLDRWEIEDRSRIIYNDRVTIRGIPLAAYDYVVNGKSAIEWVMERYQVTTNKDSGIVNDPNKWLVECGNERYIVDLILKVVTVSMETQKIVAKLPVMEF